MTSFEGADKRRGNGLPDSTGRFQGSCKTGLRAIHNGLVIASKLAHQERLLLKAERDGIHGSESGRRRLSIKGRGL